MLRLLLDCEPAFQGTIHENCWRTQLAGNGYQPAHGTGLTRIGTDGLPVGLVWAFVDDFMIHALTCKKLTDSLSAFMDQALRLGYICQKVKCKPPAQRQKYCGFIYDTTEILTLRIPEDKQSHGLAMIHFLKGGGPTFELSRLTLVVVTGLLQSLVDATPQRIGQMYLRWLYDRLHMLDDPHRKPAGPSFYFTCMDLTDYEWLDLAWWESFLETPRPVQAYSSQQGTIGISFGDGSGSGTGGTVQILD
jgi:hypothetical protein